MTARAFATVLLVACTVGGAAGPAAAQTGWMRAGVRVWYLGAVDGGGVISSNAEEAYLFSTIVGTDATIVHHSALTHWTAPKPVETATYSVADMGPCWIHPARLQTLQLHEYWMGHEITFIERKLYTYATFPYRLLPIKALFDLSPQREIVKLTYMIPGFSAGNAYFDAATGILLYHHALWGASKMFFILAEINYNFAAQTAHAEDDGPHTGFKSLASEQSLGNGWGVGGGSVIIHSMVETRYGNTVEMRVLSSRTPAQYPDTGQADENWCFFGDVPVLKGIAATQASDFLPEQWTPYGDHLWWWLPPIGPATQSISVLDVPMARAADQSLTFTATTVPQRFHFSKLWFGADGYMTAFEAKDPTSGLDIKVGDFMFQNLSVVDGVPYFRAQMALPPAADPPTVTGINPATGSTLGGTAVAIAGTGFVAGATVTVGGVAATNVVVAGATAITATTPAHAAGLVSVVVTNPDAQAGTLAAAFRYLNDAATAGLSFDGDRATDVSLYRPSSGGWFILPSATGFDTNQSQAYTFGEAGDQPLRGDFDGDGRRDVAVYRPSSGTWFWLKSSANNTEYDFKGWGVLTEGDTPAPGDYDGDGKTDPCVFRPASGTWFILESHAGYTTWNWFGWGTADDTLVPADYDGDGLTDAAVYRPATGEWFVRPASGSTSWNVTFGAAGDIPVPGDFDGDGKADVAVYRPASGTWFWLKSSAGNAQYDYRGWGVNAQGDIPVPGDYDGDGITDLCVYRPQYGTWFILWSSTNNTQYAAYGWGLSDDVPLGGRR